jgi:DNA modification methylase
MTPRNQLLVGDVRVLLPNLAPSSVDCVITSPPYYRLRDYGVPGQIGLEAHVDSCVAELLGVTREVARILKPSGSIWLNVGETYAKHQREGAPPKSLLLAGERLALAMLDDGWTIRNKVVWAKTNPMPSSVRDRLSCAWETIFFATRSRRYYFDLDAIRIPHRSQLRSRSQAAARRARTAGRPPWAGPNAGNHAGLDALKARGRVGHPLGKNPSDVWAFPTSSTRGAHHATFPLDLIRRPLLATCPERVCTRCGAPWTRAGVRELGHLAVAATLRPACACTAGWQPGLVLDPFMGSGTVALAAQAHDRDWLGIEINPAYARDAHERLTTHRRDNQARAA